MSNTTVTNMESLNEMTGNNPEIIVQFIQMYLMDTPVLFEKLLNAVEQKNYSGNDSVQFCAHKIGPQLSYMGMEGSYMLAKKIESDIKEGRLEDVSADSEKLRTLIETSYIELNAYLKSQGV